MSIAPGFNRLFGATIVSNLGDGIGHLALPLLAASLTRDPALVGGLTAAVFLPWLLFALPSGALVDRLDRRIALARANIYRTAVVAGLAALIAGGMARIWILYVAAFLLGMGETVSDNAAQALLPAVVPVDKLDVANSRLQGAMIVTDGFLGAPLAGVLFAIDPPWPFVATGAGFLAAAVMILGLKGSFRAGPERPPERETRPERPSERRTGGATAANPPVERTRMRAEIAEGLRWLRSDPLVRPMVVIAGVAGIVNAASNGIMVLFALEQLGLDQRGFGLFITSAAIGGVIGSLTASKVTARVGRSRALGLSVAVAAVGYLGMGLSSHWAVGGFFFAVTAWAILLWNVVSMSLRQAVIPDVLIGRVMGAWRTVVWGCMPVGALLGGFLAKAFGLRAPFVLAAVVEAALVVPTLRLRTDIAREPAGPTDPTEPATPASPPAPAGSTH